ncbi:MAG: HAD-IA family hydrolase [Candidatus Methanofastidiosa archaeon]|nr:HAD-IA family hydrolase [Candidatus Methanofastidiosa archaeon]
MRIALVFDLDGTLVDVSNSYKEAIVRTAQLFRPGTDRSAIEERMRSMKGMPNLNNDWDATYYILQVLDGKEPKVRRDERWLEVKKAFQSIYLGRELYIRSYNEMPTVPVCRGLIENETLNISRGTLDKLSGIQKGIVTSRPRLEALYALENSYLGEYFSVEKVVSLDDVEKEKPDPEPLLKMKELLDADKYYYVGDNVDDAIASKRAGYTSIIINEKWGDIAIPTIDDLPGLFNLYDSK